MRVAIRVDASAAIGTGHVKRCQSLAQALGRCGAQVQFVMRDLGLPVVGEDTVVLPAPGAATEADPAIPHSAWLEVPQARDADETAAALADWKPDWLVVDSYALDARWHHAVRAALGCRIAVIDDLADRALAADLVIDHNFAPDHRAKYAAVAPGIRLLGGPRYALLGPAFARATPLAVADRVDSVGVFLGGIDSGGISAVTLAAIREAGFAGPVEVVSTAANPHLPALRRAVDADDAATLTLDLPDLAGFFARHQLQVGAGGGATWERCCTGAPTLLLVTAENQRTVVPALADAGVVATCEPDREAIAAEIASLLGDPARRRAMAERSRALVDGRGAERVALAMLAPMLCVRPATAADSERMFAWRNAPATRAASRQSASLDRAAHEIWLARTLGDAARTLLVGEVGEIPVGVVRFDRVGEREAEVSLYLDPALHGLGLGTHLLSAGERGAASGDMGGLDILAEVLEGNPGSARLFESSGYTRVSPGQYRKAAAPPAGDE